MRSCSGGEPAIVIFLCGWPGSKYIPALRLALLMQFQNDRPEILKRSVSPSEDLSDHMCRRYALFIHEHHMTWSWTSQALSDATTGDALTTVCIFKGLDHSS